MTEPTKLEKAKEAVTHWATVGGVVHPDMARDVDALIEAACEEAKHPTCKWTRTTYTYDDGIIYETGCGFQYGVDEDQLGDRFCWFCGGKIEEASDEG